MISYFQNTNTFTITGDGVGAGQTANDGNVTWNFSIDSGLIEYLADGETVTATYQITVDDNSVVSGVHDEATSTSQSITITIGSGNARPTITGGPVVVDKAESRDDSDLTATGDLTITDIDRTDIATAFADHGCQFPQHTGSIVKLTA